MWALRRTPNPFKFQGLSVVASRVCCAKSEIFSSYLKGNSFIYESPQVASQKCLFYHIGAIFSKFSMVMQSKSSQDGEESSESEDNLKDGFSELKVPASVNAIEERNAINGNENELASEFGLFDDDDHDVGEHSVKIMELLDAEANSGEKTSMKGSTDSELFQAIISTPASHIHGVLDKWVEEGKDLDRSEISLAMLNLYKCKMYKRALQLSEWLEANKRLEFIEIDYVCRSDLIAKVSGLDKAEKYFEMIPKSFRGEVTYRTLLVNCATANNVNKAEQVFNKMKVLQFPITAFACNQLLHLYNRVDKKKMANVLLLMEKENVKPSLTTYRILIDSKGQSNDLAGMDQIVENMKAEGIQPDIVTKAIIVKHYASGGLKEKAEAILVEMEGGNLEKNRGVCRFLLTLYSLLGKVDEVGRVWKVCESSPLLKECWAAIGAWGRLKKIDEAEAVFNIMHKTRKKLSSRHYEGLLKVYLNHKMLAKGKDLVKQMADSGCHIVPSTWDYLVKLYVEAGEVEKADSMLQKATQQMQIRPLFRSYMAIMDEYAKRGDIHNAENVFYRMKRAGYVPRLRLFNALLQTYINAKAPAYGIRERMKADNMFPNQELSAKLHQVDSFRKSKLFNLLE